MGFSLTRITGKLEDSLITALMRLIFLTRKPINTLIRSILLARSGTAGIQVIRTLGVPIRTHLLSEIQKKTTTPFSSQSSVKNELQKTT
jgi:hypothetical protein